VEDGHIAKPLPTVNNTKGRTSIPRTGFEPSKTVSLLSYLTIYNSNINILQ